MPSKPATIGFKQMGDLIRKLDGIFTTSDVNSLEFILRTSEQKIEIQDYPARLKVNNQEVRPLAVLGSLEVHNL
jgi:hypothetical protein